MFNDAGVNLIDDVVFTIITQQNSFHVNQALEKREIWSDQLRDHARVCVCVSLCPLDYFKMCHHLDGAETPMD